MVQSLPFPTTGITFTNKSKSDMVNRLISRFELRDLGIPNWPILLSELDSFEGTTNAIGTITYNGAPGKHDDTVCALMLANAALIRSEGSLEVTLAGDAPKKRPEDLGALEAFYDDLADDDDDGRIG
jgi:hypothetical protein